MTGKNMVGLKIETTQTWINHKRVKKPKLARNQEDEPTLAENSCGLPATQVTCAIGNAIT
ncbi:hypothetical protein DEO72_LG10g2171 [Vigna unguiculata]|uniref:Uncharacterized protein n=1 Tax=Vigna unguiculata TaxID=3917 RepID=A0A4D6NC99_VIGUN|nr:hypothetical protein DEO72_LG10g2171 [Vigna unguiculata]